ncbi:MAG TPA: trypsin-like serine protease [Candidatus Limnocylindrales bacterium]
MKIRIRRWVAVAGAVCVLGVPDVAQAQTVPDFEPLTSSSVETTDETRAAYETVLEAVQRQPGSFTGVRIDGPNALTLALPGGADMNQRAQAVRALAPHMNITFRQSARSRSDLDSVRSQIVGLMRAKTHSGQITAVGTDPIRGVTVIYATADSASARLSLKKRFGDAVIFRRMGTLVAAEADRNRDAAPHYGGAGIYMWNTAHTGYRGHCSTAFPLRRNGVTYLLTAAHCMPGASIHTETWATAFTAPYNEPASGYFFGTRYTTTISGTMDHRTDGTQDEFGDWALLRGSTYIPRVYNCSNVTGTCGSLPVGLASWVRPSLNAAICISGRTSGQRCRMHVTDSDLIANVGGLLTNHLVMTETDDGGCGNVQPGDSGGAVYQALGTRPGYILALGVVTAYSPDDCSVGFYTRLEGIRAWDSTVTMPTL